MDFVEQKHLEAILRQKFDNFHNLVKLFMSICNVFDGEITNFCYFLNAKYCWAINPQTNHSVAK